MSVVSTMPVTFNASLQPAARFTMADGTVRSSIDMDDYAGGFASWSGTSFAAPVLAGELAQNLLEQNRLDDPDPKVAVTAAWIAVTELVKLDRPPQA